MLVENGVLGTLAVHQTGLKRIGQILLLAAVQVLLEIARGAKVHRCIETSGPCTRILRVAQRTKLFASPNPGAPLKPDADAENSG